MWLHATPSITDTSNAMTELNFQCAVINEDAAKVLETVDCSNSNTTQI